jgi:hypothetical protein
LARNTDIIANRWAEVLENTHYALIAIVQKLYFMIRNGELWDLGNPELNNRGLLVIYNIAKKLGCIRLSQDLKYVFPENTEAIIELQSHMSFVNGNCNRKFYIASPPLLPL